MTKTHDTVLVIDDNEINRKYLKSVLSNNKFKPIVTESGYEALATLRHTRVELILVDIQMPEMDGFECFREIKKEFGLYCPILAITAFSDINDKKEIIEFGFHDYIAKPVKPNVLLDTLNYWISHFEKPKSQDFKKEIHHLDQEVLMELRRFTDNESLFELIDEFIEELHQDAQSIAFLKSADKYSKILSILHTIKGNAGSFGFALLSYKAAQIEAQIREGRLDRVDTELENFLEYTDFLFLNYKRLLKIN